jgi:hypothetical protein
LKGLPTLLNFPTSGPYCGSTRDETNGKSIMKIAIVQAGVGDSGKSTTIRQAYSRLRSKYPGAEIQRLLDNDVDFRVILAIQNIKIGIESYGDPWKREGRIEKSLALFVETGCDVVICASRSRGKTKGTVESLVAKGYDVDWRIREREEALASQNERNHIEARYIFDKIESLFQLAPA